jgi:hypothetical protein
LLPGHSRRAPEQATVPSKESRRAAQALPRATPLAAPDQGRRDARRRSVQGRSPDAGVDPAPPSITVFLDTTPPAAPRLLEVPAKVSRDGKPDFRFESADDHAFPGEGDHPGIFYEPFDASLRRIRPPGPTLHSSNPFDSYVSIWRQRCLTTYQCSASARPVYEAGSGSLGFGIPELLRAGLYEFRIQARDAVGNESPATRYRFRILRAKTR